MRRIMPYVVATAMAVCLNAASASAESLTTTFSGGNGASGNIFDINVGPESIVLSSLGVNIRTATDVTLYYRVGGARGYESSLSGWTLASRNTNVASAGENIPSTVDITDLLLSGNTRYGIYLVAADTVMRYTDGASVGAVAASDQNLTVYTGYGVNSASGELFAPRTVNAKFVYEVASAIPEPATWALMFVGFGMIGAASRRSNRRPGVAKLA